MTVELRSGESFESLLKRFRKEVGNQVRQKVLMQSLQQLGEDHKLDAINEPDLDVESLILPENGDFTYEFDVEVRPEFDLPNYSGLTIITFEEEPVTGEEMAGRLAEVAAASLPWLARGAADPTPGGQTTADGLVVSSGPGLFGHAHTLLIRRAALERSLRFCGKKIATGLMPADSPHLKKSRTIRKSGSVRRGST